MAEAVLEVDRLSKSYGGKAAVDAMTFEVKAGEMFGFVGSNGAGKTTTMRIILGVLAADAGEVRWRGRPVDFTVRRRIGYMPEERGLYPRMRVDRQLRYLGELHGLGKHAARRAAAYWIDRLGLAAHSGDEVQNLSLGNQQRVQLAAALVHDPEVLILDEPFSGLDPVAVDVMREVLDEQCTLGVPVLFSSHQLELVEQVCHRVGIVSGGGLVSCGTVAELHGNAEPRLMVEAPRAPAGWAEGLPGVRVLRHEGPRTHLALTAGADDQEVLHAALATGPVHAFEKEQPSLAELFRDIVSREAAV